MSARNASSVLMARSFDPEAGEKVSGGVRAWPGPPSTASWRAGVRVVLPAPSVYSIPSPSSTVSGRPDEIASEFFPSTRRTRIEVAFVWPSVVPG